MIDNLPIKHDEKHTDTWRKSKKPLFRKAIFLNLPIFLGPHRILLVLIASVKGRKIKVG